jgi:hypothetical protein
MSFDPNRNNNAAAGNTAIGNIKLRPIRCSTTRVEPHPLPADDDVVLAVLINAPS